MAQEDEGRAQSRTPSPTITTKLPEKQKGTHKRNKGGTARVDGKAVASLAAEHGLWGPGASVAAAPVL